MTDKKNIFDNIPKQLHSELFSEFVKTSQIKIERIVSMGHSSEADQWYDQDKNEWVFLLEGHAVLEFGKNGECVELQTGDYLNIAAHVRHRVKWTSPHQKTIWLAVHY